MSKWSEILDDVVVYLNNLILSQDFTAISSYKPKTNLIDMGSDISVIVFPRAVERELINRGTVRKSHETAIAITKKFDANDLDIDSMVDFVEEMATALDHQVFSCNSRSIGESTINPVYDYEKFNEKSIFQSLITITVNTNDSD